MNRRNVLAASMLGAPLFLHAAPRRTRLRPSLTEHTAPDAISRDILSRRMTSRSFGAKNPEDFPDAMNRNFAQVIEQNFAERDGTGMADLLDGMSEAEASDLAQLYVNATTTLGQPERLMFVLAHRLDERRLARIGRHFGFERTYHAVYSIAPRKVQGFLSRADTRENGPTPGEDRFGPEGRFAPGTHPEGGMRQMAYSAAAGWRMRKTAAYTAFLHQTPTQIFQAMRTARYGSLSREGAFLEAASIMTGALGRSFGVGYGFGTIVVKPVIEAYAPDLYVGLGNWIGPVADTMIAAWNGGGSQALAQAHSLGASSFAVPSFQLQELRIDGGDFTSVIGLSGGGGGLVGCTALCPYFDQE